MSRRLLVCAFVLSLSISFGQPSVRPVQAAEDYPHHAYLSTILRGVAGASLSLPALPALAEFSAAVTDGSAGVVRGVYVAQVLALPVVQQPDNLPAYVASTSGVATQFSLAANFGVTGLLAHNTAAGRLFFELEPGDRAVVVYGDGHRREYEVSGLLRYQALQPNNAASDFIDLETDQPISATEVFKRVYMGTDHLVFQTCIAANGVTSWGRLFVIATPVP